MEISPISTRRGPGAGGQLDTLPCLLTTIERRGPHHFTLRITPPGGRRLRLLRLQALTGGSPAEDGVSGMTGCSRFRHRRDIRLRAETPIDRAALTRRHFHPTLAGRDITGWRRGMPPDGEVSAKSARRCRGPTVAETRAAPSVARHLAALLALDAFEAAARRICRACTLRLVSGAAETDAALRDNRDAFGELGFVPRVLADVSGRQQARPCSAGAMTRRSGSRRWAAARWPPTRAISCSRGGGGGQRPDDDERRLADTAGAGAASGPAAWFQAYLPGEHDAIEPLVERVARAGYDTFVLTVDVQVAANRENNVRTGFHTPLRPSLRLAWDGMIRPRWLFGIFLRTLLAHGMPHFENMGARGPLISRAPRSATPAGATSCPGSISS